MDTVSKQLLKHLIEENGPDQSKWSQGLRDLVDPSIEAVSISPPISGKVDEFLNTDYHYYWAKDVCGQTPFHDRVESMRYAGWQFANTDDVRMCSESAIIGRKGEKKSKDGRNGFSDEIRSGDRRLMKLPMRLHRSSEKARNMKAYQYVHPQAFGNDGKPMSAANLIPGMKSHFMDGAQIDEARRNANASNSVTVSREGA